MQPHTCHEGVPLSQFLAKKFKCRIGKCLSEGDINYYFADHTSPFLYWHFPGNFLFSKIFTFQFSVCLCSLFIQESPFQLWSFQLSRASKRRAACFGQRADWQLCCVVCSAPGLGVLLLCWARRWTRLATATLFCSAVCWGLQETQAEHCRVVCRHCAAGEGKNVTALITKKYPAFYLGEKQWIYETCKIVQRNSSVEWEEMRVACDKFDSQRNNWGSFLVILNCFRKRSQRISTVDPETNFASSENN